jgi:hypothetical protein
MNENLDCRLDDERADPEADARKLYAGLAQNPALLTWLENHAWIARDALSGPAS